MTRAMLQRTALTRKLENSICDKQNVVAGLLLALNASRNCVKH
jgi:hypothetical protein